ncbi:MAG: M48 family metallopeptidase [Ignavibacteriaceae bacterium]|nr:M48 family metallopeptidase [Ignavibacteriaceae bacterium]
MKIINHYVFPLILMSLLFIQCSTVPITGRKQLNIIPASQMQSLSYQQYGDFIKSNKLSKDQNGIALVKRVGIKIQKAVEQYMAQNNLSSSLNGYNWEFNLVEDPQVNAWCMPGGKVVVYTGILPITKDEAGLAVVLGHEIAHAIAQHGDERMSQGLITQLGGVALQKAIETKPAVTQQIFMSAFGIGTQVGVLLPYSRLQESEADHLGLIFMAMAGYDPNLAVPFWQRMSSINTGQKPPELLSDHPADATRIQDIQKEIPEASKYYKK